jgi:hypothetical protein
MKNKMRVITSLLNVQQKYIMTEPPKMTYWNGTLGGILRWTIYGLVGVGD